jgi:hypothetical protein
MGRSVYVPSDASCTAFIVLDDTDDDFFDFDDVLESVRLALADRYPSLEPCNYWIGREGHAIAHNRLGVVVVAEYCGLASVSLCPVEVCNDRGHQALAAAWCRNNADKFKDTIKAAFAGKTVHRIATASNGETFYNRDLPTFGNV